MIDLCVLGGLDLRFRDGPRAQSVLAQPKRMALLCYLSLARPRGFHRRDKLLALFWPETDTEHARASLRQSILVLRRALGDAVIRSRGDEEVALGEGLLTCDALEFEAALAAGELERALALYGGELLPGFFVDGAPEFERWLETERSRLRDRALKACHALAGAADQRGDTASAAEWERRALELGPADDALLLRHMQRLARAGDAAGALTVFDTQSRRWWSDFEIQPAAPACMLADELRRRAAVVTAGTARDRPAPATSSAAPAAASGVARAASATAARKPRSEPGPPDARSRRRWWTAAAVAAVIVTAVGTIAIARRARSSPPQPERVLVLPPVNQTGDTSLEGFGRLAADWISDGLAHAGRLQVVPTPEVLQMLRAGLPPDSAARLRRAGTLVSGRYYRSGGRIEVRVEVSDMATGRLWHSLPPVVLDTAAPATAVEELRQRVTGVVAARVAPFPRIPPPSLLAPPNYPALVAFSDASALFFRGEYAAALPLLDQAVRLDTSFVRAELAIGSVYLNLGQPARADSVLARVARRSSRLAPYERILMQIQQARLRGDIPGRLDAMRRAARIYPGHNLHYLAPMAALEAGRPRDAVELGEGLDLAGCAESGCSSTWWAVAGAYHLLEDDRRALALALRWHRLRPDNLAALEMEVRALAGLGRMGPVPGLLRTARTFSPRGSHAPGDMLLGLAGELHRHGHPAEGALALEEAARWCAARSAAGPIPDEEMLLHARVFSALGRMREADSLVSLVRARAPGDIEALGLAGVLAARRGDFAGAAVIDDALASIHRPYLDGAPSFWRAVIAAHSHRPDAALGLLDQAFRQGRPRGIRLHEDVMLQPLWSRAAFSRLVAEQD